MGCVRWLLSLPIAFAGRSRPRHFAKLGRVVQIAGPPAARALGDFGPSGPLAPEKVKDMKTSFCRRSSILMGVVFLISCREPRQGGQSPDGGLDMNANGGRSTIDSGIDKPGSGGGAPGS